MLHAYRHSSKIQIEKEKQQLQIQAPELLEREEIISNKNEPCLDFLKPQLPKATPFRQPLLKVNVFWSIWKKTEKMAEHGGGGLSRMAV